MLNENLNKIMPENYREESTYENHLIIKIVGVSFVKLKA
jgi:hypothetical protein